MQKLAHTHDELLHRSCAREVLTEQELASATGLADYLELYSDALRRVAKDPHVPSAIEWSLAMSVASGLWRFAWTSKSAPRWTELVEECRDRQAGLRSAFESSETEYRLRELYRQSIQQALQVARMVRDGLDDLGEERGQVLQMRRTG